MGHFQVFKLDEMEVYAQQMSLLTATELIPRQAKPPFEPQAAHTDHHWATEKLALNVKFDRLFMYHCVHSKKSNL